MYTSKKVVGTNTFSAQFIKTISHYKNMHHIINALQHTACLVVTHFAFLLTLHAGGSDLRLYDVIESEANVKVIIPTFFHIHLF